MLKHSVTNMARSKNIQTEMHAGKPPKVAMAIAYSVQREAKKAARKRKRHE